MIDLHCHTAVSDNSLTVTQILELASLNCITRIAITDHDTTCGLEEAVRLGEQYDVTIIPGIEISAFDYERHRKVHILGLWIDENDKTLMDFCMPVIRQRQEAAMEMVEKVREYGFAITWEDVCRIAYRSTNVYKQHIMHALLDKGYCHYIHDEVCKSLFNESYNGKWPGYAFVPIEYPTAEDAVMAVKQSGGLAVLAHPGLYDNYAIISRLVKKGLDGIECIHPGNTPEQTKLAFMYARHYKCAVTGGTDFHGFYGTYPCLPGEMGITDEEYEKLYSRKIRTLCK
ncbi:MAG: PHP domain-containing protein [Spirochaetales bacterium]|nr:PHP domain-containing protein [Spirochaetales bacterium]